MESNQVITEALKLERGGVYVIESANPLTQSTYTAISDKLRHLGEKCAVTFILLDGGLKVARQAVAA